VRRLRGEGGYTLIEMLTVLLIFGTVMTALMALFVQGTNAEVDMQNRFQAQQEARLALNKLRREAHCASAVSAYSQTSITLTMASYCPTAHSSVTWCTVSIATSRYGLYRKSGGTCDATGVKFADYLTTGNVFTAYSAQSTSSLAKLSVLFPVNPKPKRPIDSYQLSDDIVLRNSVRQ
jgi:prepilin-type N-terminal cleavage/methylation domain-containing protein